MRLLLDTHVLLWFQAEKIQWCGSSPTRCSARKAEDNRMGRWWRWP
jgi:PIN domain nuclease of toxin-antitoxin system